jgi:hypothetical protein
MLAGAAGLAYKVISGYRHPAPESFVSFEDRNKLSLPAAPAVEAPPAAATNAAPPVEARSNPGSAASGASNQDSYADSQDNSECTAIKTEQHEIQDAFNKPHSAEESRYLQRRQLKLAEQSAKRNCAR